MERDGRWVARGDVEEIGIPDGVREVIGRRLDRLSPAANTVLQVAAVIGREFEFAVLSLLVDLDADALLGALDEAVDSRLVYETGVAQYEFSHALVRSALYDELRPTRRAHVHERVADAIRSVHERDLEPHLGEIAHHYARSVGTGSADRAAEFACRAGEQALIQLAHDDAVSWFEQALDLVEVGGARRDALGRILVGLGAAQKYAGHPQFRETLLTAAAFGREHGDDAVLVAAALANNRGFWSNFGVTDEERVAMTRAAIATTAAATASAVRARLLGNLATETVFSSSLAERRALTDQALAIAREADEPSTLAHALVSRCVALWHPSTLDERLEHGEELAGLVEQLGDPHLAYFTGWYEYAALVEAARLDDADIVLARCGELAGTLGQSMPVWSHAFTRAGRTLLRGDLDGAEALAEEQLDVGTRGGQPDAPLYYGALLLAIRLEQGRVHEIADLVADFGRGEAATNGVEALWGITACVTGDDDDAAAVLARLARDDFASTPEHQAWSSILWGAGIVAAHLHDQRAAECLYDLLRPYDGLLVFNGLWVSDSMAGTLGMLAHALDRPDAALAHLARAEAQATAIGAPLLAARARRRRDGGIGFPVA